MTERRPWPKARLSQTRLAQWLLPILLELASIVEVEIVIVIALLWSIGFAAALVFRWAGLILSLVVSFFVAVLFGLSYISFQREGPWNLSEAAGLSSFFAGGLAVGMFSLVGDCIVGSVRMPSASLRVACTEGAGIGFGITALLVIATVGTGLAALLKLAVGHIRSHWS